MSEEKNGTIKTLKVLGTIVAVAVVVASATAAHVRGTDAAQAAADAVMDMKATLHRIDMRLTRVETKIDIKAKEQ